MAPKIDASTMAYSNEWTLVQRQRKKRTFAGSFLRLVAEWIAWRIDTVEDLKSLVSSSETAMQFIWQDLERWIRVQIEFLRTQWSYSEDCDFLMFLRMLIPCAPSLQPVEISYGDLVIYREEQLKQCRKKTMHNLTCLGKSQKIPQGVATIIAHFAQAVVLDSPLSNNEVTLDISPDNYTAGLDQHRQRLGWWEEYELSKEDERE